MLAAVDGLLGQPDGDGRARRPAGASSSSAAASSSSAGHGLVDQPPVGGVGAADLLAEQQHLLGPGHADQPGQQPRGAAVGAEPAVDERLPEVASSAATVKSAARARWQPRPAAQPRTAQTTGSCDGGDELDQPVRGRAGCAGQIAGARALGRRVLVATQSAPAQKSSPAPRDVDGPQRVVGGRGVEDVDEIVDHQVAQRVTPVGRSRVMRRTDVGGAACRHRATVGVVGAPWHRLSAVEYS